LLQHIGYGVSTRGETMIWTGVIGLLVYWGFAGVLGTLLRQRQIWIGVLFGGMVFFPASAGFPADWLLRVSGWIIAVGVFLAFLKCPPGMPAWLWGKTFALAYLIVLMFMITIWGTISGYLGLGIVAGIAGILGIYRLGIRESY
jgi:hypothetical protein